jgi:hypothetical protein
MAETGLPMRRSYEAFSEFRLFGNSPPLVLYRNHVHFVIEEFFNLDDGSAVPGDHGCV